MILSLLAFLISLFAIGFLIFIHEFGHYWMAKRVGMRVETFSIGFGSPIYEWKRKNGEAWQVGWLPLGGYVKIAGTDKTIEDPYSVPDGFFGKSPWARIKVAFMGPLVNIIFAFLAFTIIWALGGRTTVFKFYNNIVGGVVKSSPIYNEGVRAGDEIVSVDGKPYEDLNLLFLNFLKGNEVNLEVKHPNDGLQAIHIAPPGEQEADKQVPLMPFTMSQYIIFDPTLQTLTNSKSISGAQKGDILIWFDGSNIYSSNQLAGIVAENKALLTIQRDKEIFLRRVPRITIGSIKLDHEFREELNDWQHESGLIKKKLNQLTFIPYALTSDNVVEFPARFIDKEDSNVYFPSVYTTTADEPLHEGDRIIAVDGTAVKHPSDLLKGLQEKRFLSLVYRDTQLPSKTKYDEAVTFFKKIHDDKQFDAILSNVGTTDIHNYNQYTFLQPVQIDSQEEELVPTNSDHQKDPKSQELYVKKVFDLLGTSKATDLQVTKQRNPFEMMVMSVIETYVPLYLMVTGKAKMDMVRGPIGVFEVVAQGLMEGISNALYTLGFISLNLALINLLPFPVLDGGSILISTFEKFSGRRLTIKTLERLIIPFALLILGAMVFFTFNDLMRLFKGL